MTFDYVIRRIGIFLLVVWAAASINFFIPKLAPGQDPILGALLEATQEGGIAGDAMLDIAAEYRAKYGLDQPLHIQYVRYLGDLAVLDFGVSFVSFSSVRDIILARLPWTIGLLGTATVMGFVFSMPNVVFAKEAEDRTSHNEGAYSKVGYHQRHRW